MGILSGAASPGWPDEQRRQQHDTPRSLERGLGSERAMTRAVAEMYVQGVSTRKVTAIGIGPDGKRSILDL